MIDLFGKRKTLEWKQIRFVFLTQSSAKPKEMFCELRNRNQNAAPTLFPLVDSEITLFGFGKRQPHHSLRTRSNFFQK
jgi:hypothetical protein